MNIGILINSLTHGGAEKVVLSLAECFYKTGITVTLILLERDDVYEKPDFINIIYLSDFDGEQPLPFKFMQVLKNPFQLRKIVKKLEIDLVQSHLYRSNYINALCRLIGSPHKVQLVNHGMPFANHKRGLVGRLHLFGIKNLYPRSDEVVAVSNDMSRELTSINTKSNMTVVYNPIDFQKIDACLETDNVAFEFDPAKRYVCCAGRLTKLKRFKDVISAVSLGPKDVNLIILGEGEEKRNLQRHAKSLNVEDRVVFWGHSDNPYYFMAKSDVFVLSSETEGFPLVLLEAMYCETAVISTDCSGGIWEALGSKTEQFNDTQSAMTICERGIMVPIGRYKFLWSAISKILSDPEHSATRKLNGKKYSSYFATEIVSKRYVKLMQDLLKK